MELNFIFAKLVFIDEAFGGFVTIKPLTGALAGECRELELIFIVKILSEYRDGRKR